MLLGRIGAIFLLHSLLGATQSLIILWLQEMPTLSDVDSPK